MALLFFFFFFVVVGVHVVQGQVPIPARMDGFVYGRAHPTWGDSVVVEAFFDPLCPDSRDAWPPLKEALRHYSHRVSFVGHTFPLPYHPNSFIACRALHIANKLNSSSTYPLLERFFLLQEQFYSRPTYGMSRASIVDKIERMAISAIGWDLWPEFLLGFDDTKTDHMTRTSFKYGCSRGVTGTPYFFVNGFPLAGESHNYAAWRSIIDPLIQKES